MRKLALLLLVLVACQMVPFSLTSKKANVPVVYDIMTGTSALDISFNPNSNSDILMCQQANVMVDLRNAGAYNITDGKFTFIFENQYFGAIGNSKGDLSLDGKSYFNPQGGFMLKEFKILNTGLPSQLESYSSPLIFQACYTYKTFSTVQVCIDPDIMNVNPNKPCLIQPVVLSGGQGAPVAVTHVESLMVPEGDKVRPAFAIFIQHLGSGSVVSKEGAKLACTAEKISRDALLSKVNIVVKVKDNLLDCPSEPVRLEVDKESRVICKFKDVIGMQSGTYSTVLSVEIDYGYVSSALLPVTVTRLPGQECKIRS